MLILTRRPGESVKIGDDITVTVLAIKGNQLRLGFTAPQNIAVHREEVYRRIQTEKVTDISQARSFSKSAHAVRGASAQRYVDPFQDDRRVKVSRQTREELLKW